MIRELLTAFQRGAVQLDVRYFRRTVIADFLKVAAGYMPRWSIPHNDSFSERLFLDTFDTYIRRYVGRTTRNQFIGHGKARATHVHSCAAVNINCS